jgi:hypothetical protein
MPRRNNGPKYIRQVYQKSCDSKRKYNSEREAIETGKYQMLIHPELELDVYKCQLCNKWHLTRQVKSQRSN